MFLAGILLVYISSSEIISKSVLCPLKIYHSLTYFVAKLHTYGSKLMVRLAKRITKQAKPLSENLK